MLSFLIISNQNNVFKEAKSLKQKKFREITESYLIEGIRFVEEAIKEGIQIKCFFMTDKLMTLNGGDTLIAKMNLTKIDVYEITEKMMGELCDTENPQGVVAVISMKKTLLESIIKPQGAYLVLEGLQDPGNMGTIIRTADAANFDGVITLKGCVDVYNSKVLRSTMGSIFHVPLAIGIDSEELITILNQNKIKLFATHLDGKCSYFEAPMSDGGAIIIGNEANGLSEEMAQKADVLVKIPMPGRAESLNASVAAALMMYEMVRQKIG